MAVAAVLAVAQLIDAFFIEAPIAGIVFATLTGALAWWTWRSSAWIPVALLLVLATLELVMVVFVYPNAPSAPPAWRLAGFAVLSAATAILAAVTLITRVRGSTAGVGGRDPSPEDG